MERLDKDIQSAIDRLNEYSVFTVFRYSTAMLHHIGDNCNS